MMRQDEFDAVIAKSQSEPFLFVPSHFSVLRQIIIVIDLKERLFCVEDKRRP